ncbi:type VI secretion system-associated FHA domain protein TagH [Vibrio parahaemolyticus]|nr:type VI secretion system-associated FHA domain protein TagH [Vibrio parahaemolyticus]
MRENVHELTLSVSNVSALTSGCAAQMICYDALVVIGTDKSAHWHLDDNSHRIQAQHCQIECIDDAFCLTDLCSETYVNGASAPLGFKQSARLKSNDEFRIGSLLIKVGADLITEDKPESIDSLFDEINPSTRYEDNLKAAHEHEAEPLAGLDALLAQPKEVTQSSNTLFDALNEKKEDLGFTPQSDSEFELSSSITLKKQSVSKETQLTGAFHHDTSLPGRLSSPLEAFMENSKDNYDTSNWHAEVNQDENHLLAGPMMSGLGIALSEGQNMTEMHQLSYEIGESLQACVKGLLAVHEQVSQGRFGALNRNLQPIEDNPLRLGLSYQETMNTMFDEAKSSVHLSPQAAICESLKHVRDHHDAMLHATSVALAQILEAFSPDVLLRRFSQYRRNHAQASQEASGWAWQMYSDYYQELISFRQQGFEKLYWEIFEQAYDRKIREIQRES